MTEVEPAAAIPQDQHERHANGSSNGPAQNAASDLSRSASTSSHHPDLSNEVAALSDKLIRAINQQTTLDDTLAHTRQELEEARKRVAQLEAEVKERREMLAHGELITKADAERYNTKLAADLEEEKRQKSAAQQEKKNIEAELENLTASLFDEANKMVATANKEREATEKKNRQLRDQIKDGELLLASQSEQLAELKVLMQNIGPERMVDGSGSPQVLTGPMSPEVDDENHRIAQLLHAMNLSPVSPDTCEVSPAPSTTFSQLIKPVCRSDIPAYDDFRSLVQLSTRSNHPSRAGSGSYGGLGVIGITSLSSIHNLSSSANNSTTSLSSPNHATKSVSSPIVSGPSSTTPTPLSPDPMIATKGPIPLKETKFYKRILIEDVEPTLRLDLSPTLSWLNRRSILNALADSSLIVEPIPEASRKLYGKYTPCALCGESRKEEENPRTHRMRVNEGDGATKWSLCLLCLEKVRGVGDLVGYVRMIRDGVVKCQDAVEEAEAWEELIRLRERLFWARMAGGVVPSFLPKSKSLGGSPVVHSIATGKMSHHASGLHTPAGDGLATSASGEENLTSVSQEEATKQLEAELDDSLTTFDNLKNKPREAFAIPARTPPSTPPRTRESGGAFPKINIPRMGMPESFWKGEVNVLR